jgi:hypothetical protein
LTRPDRPTLDGALRWLTYTAETELLMDEIEDSTTRISSLVDAAKQYSQLDQAPTGSSMYTSCSTAPC